MTTWYVPVFPARFSIFRVGLIPTSSACLLRMELRGTLFGGNGAWGIDSWKPLGKMSPLPPMYHARIHCKTAQGPGVESVESQTSTKLQQRPNHPSWAVLVEKKTAVIHRSIHRSSLRTPLTQCVILSKTGQI